MHGPCEGLLPKLQGVGIPRDKVNLLPMLDFNGDMAQEDILELIIDDNDNDNIINIEG